jgi:hypothetical protein
VTSPAGGERTASRASAAAGAAAAFVAAVWLARAIRPALLLDADSAWAVPRLALWLALSAAAAAAGAIAAAGFLLLARTAQARTDLEPLPLSGRTLGLLAGAALCAGTLLRFAALDRIPESLWLDDASLIAPALSLACRPADFSDAVRAAPFGVERPYGSVGVLYLEAYRLSLRLFGTTVFGVRFPSALAGSLSIVTGALLAKALLPRGAGTLAAVILAGLRWSLILSRWGWVQIALAPIVDIACLLAVAARRRGLPALALAAGVVAGLGAHVYLSAWIAGVGLLGYAAWPRQTEGRRASAIGLALALLAGFAAAAAPLFLFREGRRAPYFARAADHSAISEMRRERSAMPALAAAADSLAGPWLLADPSARHDLPGRRRLGILLGALAALGFARALFHPREEVSALLLAQAGAFLLAGVAGGQAGIPNGARFAYLVSLTAVAAAAGAMAVVGAFGRARRRGAALGMIGVIAIDGAAGARAALSDWPSRRETFDGFHGQDTLIGRAASRWSGQGGVSVEPGIGHSDVLIGAIREYRLDPSPAPAAFAGRSERRFDLVSPPAAAGAPGRVVERVRDAWGREWAVVVGRRETRP